MRIEVTQEDIDQGRKYSCKRCPVALAVRRRIPGVTVGGTKAWFSWGSVTLPKEVTEFIHRFDENLPVSPFSFELKVYDEN